VQVSIEGGEHVLSRPPIMSPCHQLLLVPELTRYKEDADYVQL
jgi:hypothetical protein